MNKEKYKTFEELKEELGDKYDKFMYDMNLELVKQKEKEQQELDKYKNIVEELEKGLYEIRHLTFSKYNFNEWTNCLSFNDDIKPLLDKLKELKGE